MANLISPHVSTALASVGDSDGTRTMVVIIALLVVLGLGLVMVAVWLFKTTRPDPELLAPLEAMGERKWQRADPDWQRNRLDELRPDGAEPLERSEAPSDLDEIVDRGQVTTGSDDRQDDESDAAADSHDDDAGADAATTVDGISVAAAAVAAAEERSEARPAGSTLPDGTVDPGSDREARAEAAVVGEEPLGGDATPSGSVSIPPSADDDLDLLGDLPEHEIDPDILAAAMAELDAELAADRGEDSPSDDPPSDDPPSGA